MPTTRQEVLDACYEYSDAVCRAFGACTDSTEAEIARCVAEQRTACEPELAVPHCWDEQRDAYERCLDVEDQSCDTLCGDVLGCVHLCPWLCPPQPPAEGPGRPSWFTDATPWREGLLFSAAAEVTDDPVDDGACVGCAIGWLVDGAVRWREPVDPCVKLEGIAAEGRRLFAVADADDRARLAPLFTATLPVAV